jgi:hypothetical protein
MSNPGLESESEQSPDFDAIQDKLDQWIPELKDRLELDDAQLKKALVDWVFINTDTDWLALAAKDDATMGNFGSGDLSEFLRLATEAFQDAWGNQSCGTLEPLDLVLEQIEDLIDAYRDRRNLRGE